MGVVMVHPVAELFPMLDDAKLDELADDIKANGLREPIVRHRDGRVIDGRNRLEACRRAGVEPRFRTFEEPDEKLLGFVLSLNLRRRHLDEGQRAMVAARVATMRRGRPAGGGNAGIQALTQAEAAERVGVSRDSVQKARQVLERGSPELVAAVDRREVSLNKAVGRLPPAPAPVRPQPDEWATVSLERWRTLDAATRARLLDADPAAGKVPGLIEQEGEDIGWARWSLNAITGCKHPCPFCYAREIAESARLRPHYPFGFAPAIRPRHFLAPLRQRPPARTEHDVSLRNIFFGSMADVFGRWVPDEWVERTLEMCREAPEWNFLFLTKFPKRLAGLDFPPNAWVGTSVIEQRMVPAAEAAFAEVRAGVRWLSVEPMLTPLKFTRLDLFQWVVIGGASRTARTPEWRPPYAWVRDLIEQARAAGCAVYQKTNLAGGARLLEMPGGLAVRQDPGQRAPEELFPRGAQRAGGRHRQAA